MSMTLPDFDNAGHANPATFDSVVGDHMGVLFLELPTRRRLRVNGVLSTEPHNKVVLSVAEAYPNCPKYIQRWQPGPDLKKVVSTQIETGNIMTEMITNWISSADTFFVTSALPGGAVDVSHRGGSPGFVVLRGDVLRIPDYPGNSMFGTLGNFAANPRAGLAFVDFVNNRQLQLTGDVRLDLEGSAKTSDTGGTGRWWEFTPRQWVISYFNKATDWVLTDRSSFNP